MATLTEIEPCEAPLSARDQIAGPSTDMDHQILQFLAQHPGVELRAITRAVDDTTHHVHARVQTLIDRGLVRRSPIPGGPRRGPGASRYRLTPGASPISWRST